jgi:hypothetical protein
MECTTDWHWTYRFRAAQARSMTTSAPTSLTTLLDRVRAAIHGSDDDASTARRVAAAVRAGPPPPTPDALTDPYPPGGTDRIASRVLHAEPAFSVLVLVVPPGGKTTVHDHLTWGVVAVLAGAERETLFRDDGDHLTVVGHATNPAGTVTAFAPPGDIHRIRGDGVRTAVSLHVYGTDLRVTGSSARRVYDLPIRDTRRNG